MDFLEFNERFSSKAKMIDRFIEIRYGNKVKRNHCGSEKIYQRKTTNKVFDCNDYGNTFSIFKGTIFEKTSTDLRKWMYAIHLFLNSKKGISGLQLQREIKVTCKTAWRMLRLIRQAMRNVKHGKTFKAMVEIDKTCIGGKPRKTNGEDNGKHNKRGRGTKKNPVVGIVDREQKKVYAKVSHPIKKERNFREINS